MNPYTVNGQIVKILINKLMNIGYKNIKKVDIHNETIETENNETYKIKLEKQ